jgi:hypothetical protein
MKVLILICLELILLAANLPVCAQVHPCSGPGPGEVVVGQTQGGQGVASVPLCQSADQQQASAPPSLKWESRWGAVATDASHGALGSVTDIPNQRAAEKGAIDDCKAKGGVNCTIQLPYKNACTALVVGDTKFIVTVDKTAEIAGKQGIDGCSKDSANCHVYFTA